LGIAVVTCLVENAPLLNNWLLEHLIPCQSNPQILPHIIHIYPYPFLLFLLSRPHHYIACVVFDAAVVGNVLGEVEAPLLHEFGARLAGHQSFDELFGLVHADWGVSALCHLDLAEDRLV